MSIHNSYYIFLGLFSIFIFGLILYLNAPKKEGFLPNLPDDRDTCFMAGGSWMNNECMILLPHPAFKSKSGDSPNATVCPPCPVAPVPVRTIAPTPIASVVAPTPIASVVAPTPIAPTPIAPTPIAPTPIAPIAPLPVVPEKFVMNPSLLYRASDNGYTANGQFASHFPSSTQIILDSRTVNLDSNGNLTGFGSTAESPIIGSAISGKFIQPGTTVLNVQDSALPSNPYVPGQLITLSMPLVNITEDRGDVFVYSFTRTVAPSLSNSTVTSSGPIASGPALRAPNPINFRPS